MQFCRVVPDLLTTDHVRVFLLYLTQERKLSFSTFNQALHAVRFFFIEVLKRPFVLEGLRYQRPPRRLPVVMSEEEVKRLLEGAHSLRDRALLETGYATGMRVSEVSRLLITDIDSQLMQIRVEQGKGRKDRYVMLSPTLLALLRSWWREANARGTMLPHGRLFPGQDPLTPLSARQLGRHQTAGVRAGVQDVSQRQGALGQLVVEIPEPGIACVTAR